MDNAQVVEYIEITQAAIKKASAENAARVKLAARVAAQAEVTGKALIDAGLIRPTQKRAGVEKLQDHLEALTLLQAFAERHAASAPEPMGKVASAPSPSPASNGGQSPRKAESDLAFEALMQRGIGR